MCEPFPLISNKPLKASTTVKDGSVEIEDDGLNIRSHQFCIAFIEVRSLSWIRRHPAAEPTRSIIDCRPDVHQEHEDDEDSTPSASRQSPGTTRHGAPLRIKGCEVHDAMGLVYRQVLLIPAIDDGENSHVDADTKRQGEHDGSGRRALFARCETQIL